MLKILFYFEKLKIDTLIENNAVCSHFMEYNIYISIGLIYSLQCRKLAVQYHGIDRACMASCAVAMFFFLFIFRTQSSIHEK